MLDVCFAQLDPHAERLISQIGCTNCHSTLKIETVLKTKIPNLSYAGLRYTPSYLFDFLQNPQKIRRHIGPSRMPNFHLSEKEALALVLFLETQNRIEASWPAYPAELSNSRSNRDGSKAEGSFKMLVVEDWTCLSCHSLNGKGGVFAVDLSTIGYRLKADWVKKYLAAPSLFDVPRSTMLAVFYEHSPSRRRLIEILPDAAEQINRLTDHLFSLNRPAKEQFENVYQKAKGMNPRLTAEIGEKIFRSQNCTACHSHRSIQPSDDAFAPDLSIEGFRVHEEWLSSFLEEPSPIRPFGFQPSSGNRMPDFELSEGKVQTLMVFLMNQKVGVDAQLTAYFPQELTAFSMQKAQIFLHDKLSCLGCHRLGDQGGRIGPDLSTIHDRLNPFYMFNQMKDPRLVSPNTIMPQIPMPTRTLELIFNFLFQQNEKREPSFYLSPIENPLFLSHLQNDRENSYLKHCSLCHGRVGGGDGYNAKYLDPVKPTAHSDATYMSRRPDDTLFDGVYAGGYILNKHHFMPPWGLVLSRDEIEVLVAHIRVLCECRGPEWSRDDQVNK